MEAYLIAKSEGKELPTSTEYLDALKAGSSMKDMGLTVVNEEMLN